MNRTLPGVDRPADVGPVEVRLDRPVVDVARLRGVGEVAAAPRGDLVLDRLADGPGTERVDVLPQSRATAFVDAVEPLLLRGVDQAVRERVPRRGSDLQAGVHPAGDQDYPANADVRVGLEQAPGEEGA